MMINECFDRMKIFLTIPGGVQKRQKDIIQLNCLIHLMKISVLKNPLAWIKMIRSPEVEIPEFGPGKPGRFQGSSLIGYILYYITIL